VYPDSPVFRAYQQKKEKNADRTDGLRQQINFFLLERDAANGDPLAQHELGVRYLIGRGVEADTLKSAEWLRPAAAQGLLPAMYNLALLLNNGWGLEWNPFEAYRLFFHAAKAGMSEAQYVVGIFHTDDLVLKQDWDEAYRWIAKADAAGYAPATRAKEEIIRRGHVKVSEDSVHIPETTTSIAALDDEDDFPAPDWAPVLLDFSATSTETSIATSRLVAEFLASAVFSPEDSLAIQSIVQGEVDSQAVMRLQRMAGYGNPEAVALLGRMHETGIAFPANPLSAAALYATGVYLESARAPQLLIELLKSGNLRDVLPKLAYDGNAEAQYVWAVLRALEFDRRLSGEQALDMLKRPAIQEHTKALVQLGVCASSGRWMEREMNRAEVFWMQAAALGDEEARIRLAAAAVLGNGKRMDLNTAMPILETAASEGSILAEVALAYSYEQGIGRSVRKGEAVRMYRNCAIRGSETAYRSLRRMHEELRPAEEPFKRGDL
jgi:TPR repeat protein